MPKIANFARIWANMLSFRQKTGHFDVSLGFRYPFVKVRKATRPKIEAYIIDFDALGAVLRQPLSVYTTTREDTYIRDYLSYYYYGYIPPRTPAIVITGV